MRAMTKSGGGAPLLAAIAVAAGALLAVPAAGEAQQPCSGFYTVRSGDTLAEIATRCATTVPALLAANPAIADQRDLEPGGVVRIPPPGTGPTPVQACGAFYTLRSGDTLDEIAAKCGLTVPLLLAANPALEDPQNMERGGRVRIPDIPVPGALATPPVIIGPAASAEEALAAADTAPGEPFVRHEGTLIEADPCTLLRLRGGEVVGLVGELGRAFSGGDRVVVTGPAIDASPCGTDRALQVRIMWKPGA